MTQKLLSKRNRPALSINGKLVTPGDILANKLRRQQAKLWKKRQSRAPVTKPAFVWTFLNSRFPYGGWWLYVRTLRRSWPLRHSPLILAVMELFPCDVPPAIENFRLWKEAFAQQYPRPTVKRPQDQGMAIVSVTVSTRGDLIDIQRRKVC